jgi:hypothetical protein
VEASFGSVIGAVVRRYNSLVYRSAMHCYIRLVGDAACLSLAVGGYGGAGCGTGGLAQRHCKERDGTVIDIVSSDAIPRAAAWSRWLDKDYGREQAV